MPTVYLLNICIIIDKLSKLLIYEAKYNSSFIITTLYEAVIFVSNKSEIMYTNYLLYSAVQYCGHMYTMMK